jgi:putative nucleotidyltransferase with HDIG domain
MIKLTIKKLRKGMITAQSIYNAKGASFLTKGTLLNEQYITRLRKLGVTHLIVSSLSPDCRILPPEDIVEEKTRIDAILKVAKSFHDVEEKGYFDLQSLQDVSKSLLNDVLLRKEYLIQINDIRTYDTYTFAHSVNVAILAAVIGVYCKYSKKDLLLLILGALLHDIGKIIIPTKILNKPGTLTDEEFYIIRQHPEVGRQKLSNLKISSASILGDIAAQHHEYMDGNGYPKHLAGEEICHFARIVAIADVYDALTSARSYKKSYKPHIAYKIMKSCSAGHFDTPLLDIFFDNVAIYPVGTIVKTNLGYAIVQKVHFSRTRTPLVCVFADFDGHLLEPPQSIDIVEDSSCIIKNVLEDMEVLSLVNKIGIDPGTFLEGN